MRSFKYGLELYISNQLMFVLCHMWFPTDSCSLKAGWRESRPLLNFLNICLLIWLGMVYLTSPFTPGHRPRLSDLFNLYRYKASKVAYALLEVGVCTLTVEVYFCRVEVDLRRALIHSDSSKCSSCFVSLQFWFVPYNSFHRREREKRKGLFSKLVCLTLEIVDIAIVDINGCISKQKPTRCVLVWIRIIIIWREENIRYSKKESFDNQVKLQVVVFTSFLKFISTEVRCCIYYKFVVWCEMCFSF